MCSEIIIYIIIKIKFTDLSINKNTDNFYYLIKISRDERI